MVKKDQRKRARGGTQAMEAKSRLILAALMSSVMVAMVTFIVTVLDLGLRSGFLSKWLKAYLIAWPVAAITAFFIMAPARHLTERIVPCSTDGADFCACTFSQGLPAP
jgi:Protein of unknown function (DUF2798)